LLEDNVGVLHHEVHCKKIMMVYCIVRYIVRRQCWCVASRGIL
jgi:hypothetical protein